MNKNHNHRLVLECVILAIEVIRLVSKILVLVNATINYRLYESEVVE